MYVSLSFTLTELHVLLLKPGALLLVEQLETTRKVHKKETTRKYAKKLQH